VAAGDRTAGTFYRPAATFDAVTDRVQPGAGVLVREGRVVAVGTEGNVCPADAVVVDLGEHVIVPGFVDAHTHITIRPGEGDQHGQMQRPASWQAVRGVANLAAMLGSGVTTARIMTEEHDIDVLFKRAVAAGEVPGPALRVAGRGLSPAGKHGGAVQGVQGVPALREAVAANAAKGADHIKIFTTGGVSSTNTSLEESNYSAEEIRAIVAAAAEHGLSVSAHAHGGPGVELAVAHGVHSIEHGALLTEANVKQIAAADAWVVLTNTILFHPAGIEQGDGGEPRILAKVRQARESMARVAGLLREHGIRLALGTDSMHGLFGFEMQWMTEHGFSSQEALLAGTRDGGRLMGVTDIGHLGAGARADFVVLDRDPVADITAVHDVHSVYRAGQELARADRFIRPLPHARTDHRGEK
jgi:imidazolonepropionase-like amidohydrolase